MNRISARAHFKAFFKSYCGQEYRKLVTSCRITWGALLGKRDYNSSNPYLVMDHGAARRLGRYFVVLLGTAGRVLIGLLITLSMLALLPLLGILRALVIPPAAAVRGVILLRKIRGAERAFTGKR